MSVHRHEQQRDLENSTGPSYVSSVSGSWRSRNLLQLLLVLSTLIKPFKVKEYRCLSHLPLLPAGSVWYLFSPKGTVALTEKAPLRPIKVFTKRLKRRQMKAESPITRNLCTDVKQLEWSPGEGSTAPEALILQPV
jgi:hypothetical protein